MTRTDAAALYNPMGTTALITGASSGLGVGFAHELARRGADLVLTARRLERLEALAVDLAEKYGTVSTVIPLDLAVPGAVTELVRDLAERDIRVSTLVNNAGFGHYGSLVDAPADRVHDQVAVNVAALTDLTHALLPGLQGAALAHPHGAALVNLASTAAFQPVPRLAVYAAAKAYVLSLTEALWYETRGSGLKVTAVCPGPTDTEFYAVARRSPEGPRRLMSVDEVIGTAFAALDAPRTPPHTVSGTSNRVVAWLVGTAPRRAVVTVTGRLSRR
ncbi:SDR family NAD(P)-dependent oxidoreductase [Cryobacterium sp. SO2]|uniref:SDR family NAD(P)-dependent oxidoreductase n=1 Tax=Cryobacterium sp. SO2 TaxID=1897060 RepID=UPI00223CFCED|nr:SDR family NAD(P)-dependent oxidoreductase [Cryobacterium sp. SO2]WEO78237.1 SDR family NAD(P)-dependent oxidoreductase [Cryobacterium sp. SO2]